MPHRGIDLVRLGPRWMAAEQCTECVPGSDFEKAARLLAQLSDTITESNTLSKMPGPVGRVGCLLRPNPRPCDIRDKRNARPFERNARHSSLKLRQDWIHHPGMKRVGSAQAPEAGSVGGELLLQFVNCVD